MWICRSKSKEMKMTDATGVSTNGIRYGAVVGGMTTGGLNKSTLNPQTSGSIIPQSSEEQEKKEKELAAKHGLLEFCAQSNIEINDGSGRAPEELSADEIAKYLVDNNNEEGVPLSDVVMNTMANDKEAGEDWGEFVQSLQDQYDELFNE